MLYDYMDMLESIGLDLLFAAIFFVAIASKQFNFCVVFFLDTENKEVVKINAKRDDKF